MQFRYLSQLIPTAGLALLASCATTESFPQVKVHQNASGIEVGAIKREEPGWLIGKSWDADGKLNRPDLPARTVIEVKRLQSLHNMEPRYFTPASGTVQVASLPGYADTDPTASLGGWRNLLSFHKPAVRNPVDECQQMFSR